MNRPRWLRNWADTDDADADPGPLELTAPVPEALSRVEAALRSLPLWRVESVAAADGVLTATRRTSLWGFVDDVTIRLEPTAEGTRVRARSKSRVGTLDLGQNRRNLRELFAVLRER